MKIKRLSGILMTLLLVLGLACGTALAATKLAITTQPKSVTVASGKTAKVTIKATGDGLTYKWYYKEKGASSFKATSTFTGTTYSVTMNESRAGRQVYCKVTDKYGNSVKTKTATLGMQAALKITAQPKSVTVASGKTAKVTVKASGDGLSYKWYYKDKGASSFKATSSFTGTTYSVTMSSSRAGRQVYCKVTDKYGNSVKTKTATLNMPTPLKITTQPKSVTVKNGETVKFTVAATGDGLKYQWYFQNASADKYTKSVSATSATYSFKLKPELSGRQVYCKVTDKYGNTVNTKTAVANMKNSITITKQPQNSRVKQGSSVSASVEAQGEGLTYLWYRRTGTSGAFTAQTSRYDRDSYYWFYTYENMTDQQVYCVITDANGVSVRTKTVTLGCYNVNITQQPQTQTASVGEKMTFSIKATGKNLSYTWYRKYKGYVSDYTIVGSNSPTYSFTMTKELDGGAVFCVVRDEFGTDEWSDIGMIYLPDLTITKHPLSVDLMLGKTAELSVAAEGVGVKYAWYYKNPGMSAFKKSSVTGTKYSSKLSLSQSGRQVYCVVTDKSGQTSQSLTATIKVYAPVKIDSALENDSARNGKSVSVTCKATGLNLTYKWYYKNAGSSSYKLADDTDRTYNTIMNEDADGRKVYCVVTDQAGNTAKSTVATLTMDVPDTSGTGTLCSVCDGDGDCPRCGGDMWYSGYKYVYVNGFPESVYVTELCDGQYCYGGSCLNCGGDGYE